MRCSRTCRWRVSSRQRARIAQAHTLTPRARARNTVPRRASRACSSCAVAQGRDQERLAVGRLGDDALARDRRLQCLRLRFAGRRRARRFPFGALELAVVIGIEPRRAAPAGPASTRAASPRGRVDVADLGMRAQLAHDAHARADTEQPFGVAPAARSAAATLIPGAAPRAGTWSRTRRCAPSG